MAKKNETAAATKSKATKAEAKTPKVTIGSTAIGFLKAGKTAQETLELTQKAFPDASTTIACIYWYASKNGIKLQRPAKEKKVVKVLSAKEAQQKRVADRQARAASRPGASQPSVVADVVEETKVATKQPAKTTARRPTATSAR
jgi:hypothetical protein